MEDNLPENYMEQNREDLHVLGDNLGPLIKPRAESPFLPDGRQWAWNSSSLDPAKACPREYYYRVKRGQVAKAKSVHLLFGGWYAKALEIYHKERAHNVPHVNAMHSAVHYVLEATWIDGKPWIGEGKKTRETLIRSVIWYLDTYEHDPCETVILADGTPAVELSFRFQIDDEIWFTGHLDRLVSHNGDIYVQDQKTTQGSLGSYYFKRFDLSVQMSLYTLAAQVIWKVPVKGVLIDAAQIAVGFTRFERGFTFRSQDQLAEWIEHTKYSIHQTWAAEEADWPLNDAACGRYGGCDFMSVCSKDPRVREAYLASEFEENFRNPLGVGL